MTNSRLQQGAEPRASNLERFAAFDTATLYEAAGQTGMIDPAIRPAWSGARMCGVATTVQCPPGDNLMLHVAVANAPAGSIVVASVGSYLLAGAWGEILTVAAQARGVVGLAVDGAVRDIDAVRQAGFPVFSRGVAIGACTKERPGLLNVPLRFGGISIRPGDVIVGDADGLVVIEQERLDEVYAGALRRRQREAEIIGKLREGHTTMDLLGLSDPRDKGANRT